MLKGKLNNFFKLEKEGWEGGARMVEHEWEGW